MSPFRFPYSYNIPEQKTVSFMAVVIDDFLTVEPDPFLAPVPLQSGHCDSSIIRTLFVVPKHASFMLIVRFTSYC